MRKRQLNEKRERRKRVREIKGEMGMGKGERIEERGGEGGKEGKRERGAGREGKRAYLR